MMNENLGLGLQNQERKKQKKLASTITTVLIIGAAGYIFFLLYQSVYLNWQTSQKISSLKTQLKELERDQSRLESLIAYYKTNSFQELEARKKLGMKMPNEKVVNVKIEKQENKFVKNEDRVRNEPPAPDETNLEKWIDYLKGDQI